MADYLVKEYNLPKGNKIGNLRIPNPLLDSKNLLICYIRGLFDTDGSFYIRRKKDPVVEITSADSRFLNQIKETLIKLGFNARISKTNLYIYDKKDIEKFFMIISPANAKHLKKYQSYLNQAWVV